MFQISGRRKEINPKKKKLYTVKFKDKMKINKKKWNHKKTNYITS